MTNQTYTILGIIIAAGSLGGLVSAFTSVDEKLSISFCAKRVVVGIASAFVVPLFLNMISSTLLEKAQSDTTPCPLIAVEGFPWSASSSLFARWFCFQRLLLLSVLATAVAAYGWPAFAEATARQGVAVTP